MPSVIHQDMAKDGRKTLTVDETLADELEQYGNTRNDQLRNVLRMAESAEIDVDERALAEALEDHLDIQGNLENRDSEPEGDVDIAEVHSTLNELHEKLDRLPDRLVSSLR